MDLCGSGDAMQPRRWTSTFAHQSCFEDPHAAWTADPPRAPRGPRAWSGSLGMGKRRRPSALDVCGLLALLLLLCPSGSLQCKILKCNADFWALTGGPGAEEEFCVALRAYNSCVRRTARTCRGDLAYHSAQHGIEDLMMQHNCSKEGPTTQPRPPQVPLPQAPPPPLSDAPDTCQYERSPPPAYAHCGFFGDPHLRTFGDRFHTCRVEGAWPLIHNKYLSVQVTNTPVRPGAMATATTKITIIFKNFPECAEQKTYRAETDELPTAFTDGSRNGGERAGASSLRITEHTAGAHVEIQARYIGTTMVLRQVGRYLTFAVRMPEEVVHAAEEGDPEDLYLCLQGCPTNQRIHLSRTPQAPRGFSYHTAKAMCKERLPVEDLYFQSCVFDLLSSGDINFTMAAFYAFEDVKLLHSNSQRHHLFEEQRSRASGPTEAPVCLMLTAVLLWSR